MAKGNESGQLGGAVLSQIIAADILNELRTGCYASSTRLPAEVELAAKLKVSRTVIRDALAQLEREGYVERVRGIGTVVNRSVVTLTDRLDQKFEFNAMIRRAGHTPHADCIGVQRKFADSHLAERLGIEPGQPVLMIQKRILADDQPVLWSVDYLSASLFPPTEIDRMDFSRPIFDLLDETCGASINSTVSHISAVMGDQGIREKLALQDCEALLLLEEAGFSKLTKPVLYSLTYYTSFFDFSILRKKV